MQKKAVLEAKIASVDKYTSKGIKRAERAKKMALEGLIEVEEYKGILEAVKKEQEEVTWDDEKGVINEDKCKTVPFDQFAGMCNAGMLNPSEWWIYLTEID